MDNLTQVYSKNSSIEVFSAIHILEQLPGAVYMCDTDGYIRFYNSAAAKLWGREPVIGADLWCGSWKIFTSTGQRLPLDQCPMAVALRDKVAVEGAEIVVERPGGERRNILPHPRPVFNNDGVMIGAINMLVDVTENINIRDVNRRLNIYNEQLEQFAYASSHDLQEPLRKIRTYSSMIQRTNETRLDEQGRAYLAKISEAAEHMSDLIHDLLIYSKETNKEDCAEPTDINIIIKETLVDLELLIEEKNAEIVYNKMPEIYAVPSQMSRLFYNLINNALKFSVEGKAPFIEIKCTKTLDELVFIISDNGIGFNMQFAHRMFNLFNRLHTDKKYGGNGIGLSMCKRIVENHQGTINAFSEPGKDTTFTLRFPASIETSFPF